MPMTEGNPVAPPTNWRWRGLALLIILGAAALRMVFLTCACSLDLAPDEAHYWDWSRHLDWSYYSKGPLIAYLIKAGYALSGTWTSFLHVGMMAAVRLPAVVCGTLLLVSLYLLTVQVYRRERLAVAVVALALCLPVVGAGASIITIDAPYTCCWGWALVLGYQAVFRRSRWAWPAAGLMVGLGILAKYTMVLWLASVALFLLTSREHRRLLRQPGFWVMTAVAAVCCLPILVWNVQHDWVTVRHVSGLAGVTPQPGIEWLGPLAYLGTQCALLLVFWFFAWLQALIAHRPWKEPDAGVRYLWWLSAPMFAVFLAFSLRTGGGEPNWPVTAYISGLVLAVAWLARQLESPRAWYRRWVVATLALTCTLGLALTVFMHHSEWARPVLLRLSGSATAQRPCPVRHFDPTCRLRGWRTLAGEVDRLQAELRAQGVEPLLAGASWTVPGELGFYCQGHPTVYSLGLALGDRHSQYDLWHPNPVEDAECFLGRTFLLVGSVSPELRQAFDGIDTVREVTHVEDGQPVSMWTLVVCRGFRGFGQVAKKGEKRPF